MRPTARIFKPVLSGALALALASCAQYHAAPLGSAPEVMAPPATAALNAGAAKISRPYLQPANIDFSRPLDANAVAIITVLQNPDLKALRVQAGVADAQAFAAGLLPDPTFSFGVSKVLSGPDAAADIAGALGLDINALRRHGALKEQAQAAARQAHLDVAWAEWQTAGAAQITAVRVVALDHVAELTEATRSAQLAHLSSVEKAAFRGDVSANDLATARMMAEDAIARATTAERDLAAARLDLNRLMGIPPETIIRLASSSGTAPLPDTARLFTFAKTHRLDLAALREGYAAEEAAVRLAVLDQFPSLNLTINGNRDTSKNKILGPAVDFTLPLWNRNRGGIAVERATRAALRAEYEARLFQTRAEIATAIDGVHKAETLQTRLAADLPALEKVLAANQRAAERGDVSEAAAEAAVETLRDRQAQLALARDDAREQMIALELLAGAPREAWPK